MQYIGYNFFFGLFTLVGYCFINLNLKASSCADFYLEHFLLSIYLVATSVGFFLKSLLVGLLSQYAWLEQMEQRGKHASDILSLTKWNEIFSSPLKIIFAFTLLYLLPLAELIAKREYFPAVNHLTVWNLGRPDILEVNICTPSETAVSSEADLKPFPITGILLTAVLLAEYVIVLCVTAFKLPKQFDAAGNKLPPVSFAFWANKANRWLMTVINLLDYLLLLAFQVQNY